MGNALLDQAFALVQQLGRPLAVAAWLTVFVASVGLGALVRRRDLTGCWPASLAVGGAGLVAHLADYVLTLKITPDLSAEANPIWRVVVETWGLELAKWYGLTGKLLLCVISAELFLLYLSGRAALLPKQAASFGEFVQGFGASSRWGSIASVFSFLFALLGPYFFYVVFLNLHAEDERFAERWPSPPVAIAAYLAALVGAYFWLGWRAFRRQESAAVVTQSAA